MTDVNLSGTATIKAGTSEVARHIARVAARLFATQGYDATSVRAIVEAAGVTKPTLYYHYGSKEGLAQALLTVPMTRLNEDLQTVLESTDGPVTKLERMIEAHFASCREDPDRTRFFLSLYFGPLATGLAVDLNEFKGGMTCVMGEIVRMAAESGAIDPARVGEFARACRGLMVISILDFLYKNGDLRPGLAARLVGDLLRGFARPTGPDGDQ